MSDEPKPGVKLTKIGDGAALFAKIAAGLAMAKMRPFATTADDAAVIELKTELLRIRADEQPK